MKTRFALAPQVSSMHAGKEGGKSWNYEAPAPIRAVYIDVKSG